MKSPTLCLLLVALAAPVAAQHDHAAATQPYADLTARTIKALSEQEVADLASGNGMGFALPAELNGYPGPKHTLELADVLGLTEDQRTRTQALYDRMNAAARELGAALIEAERSLDQAFVDRQMDEGRLIDLTEQAGTLRTRLRAEHLRAHLQMMDILTNAQVHSYNMQRGYHSGH